MVYDGSQQNYFNISRWSLAAHYQDLEAEMADAGTPVEGLEAPAGEIGTPATNSVAPVSTKGEPVVWNHPDLNMCPHFVCCSSVLCLSKTCLIHLILRGYYPRC